MIMETKKNAEIPNKMIDPETGMVKVKIQDRAQIIQHSLFVSQLFFPFVCKAASVSIRRYLLLDTGQKKNPITPIYAPCNWQ